MLEINAGVVMRKRVQRILIGLMVLLSCVSRAGSEGQWERCSWAVDNSDRKAQCMRVSLPLDYGRPELGAVELAVKRRSGSRASRAQLWLVHGGPGSSAVSAIEELAFGLQSTRPEIDLYAVDHRGVGTAAALRCPKTRKGSRTSQNQFRAADWNSCIAELQARSGSELPYLTTTNSARDVGVLIERFRRPQTPVYLLGVSYGTYVLQRYLQLFPDQPSGVVLHGIANPLSSPIAGYERSFNDIAMALLDLCKRDPRCKTRFNERDPVEVGRSLVARLNSGHCAATGFDGAKWRELLATPLMRRPTQEIFPALVFRLDRCSADDVSRFKHLAQVIESFEEDESAESPLLGLHVAVSEMFADADDLVTLQAAAATYLAAPGLEPALAGAAGLWPAYVADELVGRWASYDGPLLMLQGALDPATNALEARGVGAKYRGQHQHWIEFPNGAHVLLGDTPLANGDDCALRIYKDFLDEPRKELDTTCASSVLPLDFEGSCDVSRFLLGTPDAWGDPKSSKCRR